MTTITSAPRGAPSVLSPAYERRYTIVKEIGSGTYGTVYEAIDRTTQERVALKVSASFLEYSREKMMLEQTRGVPNTIQLLDAFEDLDFYGDSTPPRDLYVLVLPLLTGTLRDIHQNLVGDLAKVRVIGAQLFSALRGLHDRHITHADLALRNIGFQGDISQICLFDFGFSFGPGIPAYKHIGKRHHNPPEELLGCDRTKTFDLWSAGCLLTECFTGARLFPGPSHLDVLKQIIEKRGALPNHLFQTGRMAAHYLPDLVAPQINLSALDEETSKVAPDFRSRDSHALEDFQDLSCKLLEVDPEMRMSCPEAQIHPFFTKLITFQIAVPKEVDLGLRRYVHITEQQARMSDPTNVEACSMAFHNLKLGRAHSAPYTFLCRPLPAGVKKSWLEFRDKQEQPLIMYEFCPENNMVIKITNDGFDVSYKADRSKEKKAERKKGAGSK